MWESDPAAYHYNSVGYIALGASVQESDIAATFERQEQIGYRSELIVGAAKVDAHMKLLFADWRAKGVTVCLHEHQGGFAFNMDSVMGLVDRLLHALISPHSQTGSPDRELTRKQLTKEWETPHKSAILLTKSKENGRYGFAIRKAAR